MMEKKNPDKLSIKSQQPAIIEDKEQEIDHLKKVIHLKNAEIDVLKYQSAAFTHKTISVSKATFFILVLLIVSLLSILIYSFINKQKGNYTYTATIPDSLLSPDTITSQDKINEIINNNRIYEVSLSNKESKEGIEKNTQEDAEPINKKLVNDNKLKKEKVLKVRDNKKIEDLIPSQKTSIKIPVTEEEEEYDSTYFDEPVRYEKYTINIPRAYLYNSPEVSAKGNYFMVPSKTTELSAIEEDNGFIYVTFLNSEGKISKGWLRKMDLRQLY